MRISEMKKLVFLQAEDENKEPNPRGDETIGGFSEAPVKPHKVKEYEEARDAIEEEQNKDNPPEEEEDTEAETEAGEAIDDATEEMADDGSSDDIDLGGSDTDTDMGTDTSTNDSSGGDANADSGINIQLDENEHPVQDNENPADTRTDQQLDNTPSEMKWQYRYLPHFSTAPLSRREKKLLEERRAAFLDNVMEYGTPAGTEAPGNYDAGCPSCADAVDPLVLDSSIEETEGTQPQPEEEGGDDMGGDMGDMDDTGDMGGGDEGGDFDLDLGGGDEGDTGESPGDSGTTTQDIEMLFSFYNNVIVGNNINTYLCQYERVYGSEDLKETAKDLAVRAAKGTWYHGVKLAGFTLKSLFKYGKKAFKLSRNGFISAFVSWKKTARFWHHKMNKRLDHVRFDNFYETTATVITQDYWTQAARACLTAYEIVSNAERAIYESNSDKVITGTIENIRNEFASIGIETGIGDNRVDYNKFMSHRQFGSMNQLGYTKETIPECMRLFEELGKCMPEKGKELPAGDLNGLMRKISNLAATVSDDADSGRVDKDDIKQQDRTRMVTIYLARLDYIITLQRALAATLDVLMKDILVVCSKLEDNT